MYMAEQHPKLGVSIFGEAPDWVVSWKPENKSLTLGCWKKNRNLLQSAQQGARQPLLNSSSPVP